MSKEPANESIASSLTIRASQYSGPKDLGRAESLYRSALSKSEIDYSSQLLFSSLIANPEHAPAFSAILAKIPAFASKGRKMVARIGDLLTNSPADAFLKSLASYCASPGAEAAVNCAGEAQKAGLFSYAATLGITALQQIESAQVSLKPASISRLIDVLEASGATDAAVRAARCARQLYPNEIAFRDREKNLLATQYLQETDMTSATGFRDTLRDREHQEAMHRTTDINTRLDELERRYRETQRLEDFRELVRAVREAPPARREAALSVLQDGHDRFGERDTLWFIREIRLDRKWSELRLHRQMVDEKPGDPQLANEHEQMRQAVLREHVDHLYEVVSSLPNTPERHRRELELAGKLLDAGRYEEAIKQAQAVKRRSDNRLDAWIIMAKSFVQLDLTPEASECFQSILSELNASASGPTERILEAKYAYAEFLLQEAEKKRDAVLARQARKLCSDVMIEDIDYRNIRPLSARAEHLVTELG
jgi:hypothetical protein